MSIEAEQLFADPTQRSLRPNRLAMAVTTAAATVIGLLPFALFLGKVPWLGWIALLAAALALVETRRLETEAIDPPSLGEWLLAGYGLVGQSASISIVGFLFYGIGWQVAAWLEQLGWIAAGYPGAAGFWTAVALLGPMTLVFGSVLTESLGAWLYDRPAGVRTPFFALVSKPRKVLMVALGGVAAFALLWVVSSPTGTWFQVGLNVILIYTALPLNQSAVSSSKPQQRAAGAVQDLLAGYGYRTQIRPRTGNPDIDPLISRVDLVAWDGQRIFAVEVKQAPAAAPALEWSAANSVRTAAAILRDELSARTAETAEVSPLLVVVGGRITDSLHQFAREQDVLLAHFPDAAVLEAGVRDELSPAEESEEGETAARIFRDAGLPVPAFSKSAPSEAAP